MSWSATAAAMPGSAGKSDWASARIAGRYTMVEKESQESNGEGQSRGSGIKALVIAVILVAVLFAILAGFSALSDFMLFDY